MKSLSLKAVSQCTLCVTLGAEHVPAVGNPNASVMLIGQSPGKQEVEEGQPFVGPSGELVNFFLDEAGLSREEVYITNALKCHPPGNRAGHPEELEVCFGAWLKKELKFVNPNFIVLIGKDAWKSVTHERIPFAHGKVTKGKKRTFLTVYHPAYYLRRGDAETFVEAGQILRQLIGDTC